MAFTKVRGRGVTTTDNYTVGVITATKFVGPITGGGGDIQVGLLTATGLDVNGNGDISGNLVVGGNLTANGDFTTLNTTLREVELLKVNADSSTTAGIITQTGAGDILNLFDGSTEVLTVLDTGEVGIGTVTPDHLLHVHKGGGDAVVTIESTGNGNHSALEFIRTSSGGDSKGGASIYVTGDTSASEARMHFGVGHNISHAQLPRMTIMGNGEVGIGSENPVAKLDVVGRSELDNVNIAETLNVVGVTTFSENVTIVKTSGPLLELTTNTGAADATLRLSEGSTGSTTNGGGMFYSGADNKLYITCGTNSTTKRITINRDDGKVGIGTDQTTSTLQIYGANDGEGTATGQLTLKDTAAYNASPTAGVVFQGHHASNNAQAIFAGIRGFKANANDSDYDGCLAFDVRKHGAVAYEAMRINEDGRLLVASTTSRSIWGANPQTQIEKLDSNAALSIIRNSNTNAGPWIALCKSRGTANGAVTIIQDGDSLGSINWFGADGVDLASTSAEIRTEIDGTPGENDLPGRLIFKTTADGASSPTERLRIDSSGHMGLGVTPNANWPTNGDFKTLQIGTGIAVFGRGSGDEDRGGISANYYHTGSAEKYIGNGHAGRIYFEDGSIVFSNAAQNSSGAGAAMTLNEKVRIDSNGHVKISNNSGKIRMGSSNQLELYHNGTYGYLNDTTSSGTELRIAGRVVRVMDNDSSHTTAYFSDSAAKLYSGNSEKLSTTSTGITVSGEVAASQDYPNQRPSVDFNFTAVKKLDPRITYTRTGPASYIDEFGKVVLVGENTPRFDHDPTTRECKGLLIEESIINQWLQSVTLADYVTGGNLQGGVTLADAGTSTKDPAGGYNATKMASGNSGGAHSIFKNFTSGSNGDVHTFSCWVKAAGADHARIYVDTVGGNLNGPGVTFSTGNTWNISATGVGTQVATSAVEYPNGWWRLSVTGSYSNRNDFYCHIDIEGGEGDISYSGNGSNGIYVWGAQFEKEEFATSYVPTNGTTATRGSDKIMIENDEFYDFYNSTESTICASYTHMSSYANTGTNARVYRFRHDGGTDSRIDHVSHTTYHPYLAADGTAVAGGSGLDAGTPLWEGQVNKWAVKVKKDDFAACLNGGTVATDTSGTWPPSNDMDQLSLGSSNGGANTMLSGHYRRFTYYPVGLSNSQLVTLTS